MAGVQIGRWNIDQQWAASLSEEQFVAYARENFRMSEEEAREAYAQLKPKTITKKTRSREQD